MSTVTKSVLIAGACYAVSVSSAGGAPYRVRVERDGDFVTSGVFYDGRIEDTHVDCGHGLACSVWADLDTVAYCCWSELRDLPTAE